ENPLDFLIDPNALSYPFQYSADEQIELIPYRLASYPRDSAALRHWLSDLYTAGQVINTFELLNGLNTRIHETIRYVRREAIGVQSPAETISLGTGSCRDYAVLIMEAARYWGFGARFVTGYVQLNHGQHGATHAWAEIYIPGAGWRGFDPTNNNFAGWDHVSVAVARDSEKACPLSGVWEGPMGAFDRMEVSVQVVEV
ncbi:MAG TPA: transglutaminase family protein, partial [Terrimicrobiaceae bacterium]